MTRPNPLKGAKMTKRTARKLELHKESIRLLDSQELTDVAGGLPTKLCILGSCGHICP
jgi:hypothetical protein